MNDTLILLIPSCNPSDTSQSQDTDWFNRGNDNLCQDILMEARNLLTMGMTLLPQTREKHPNDGKDESGIAVKRAKFLSPILNVSRIDQPHSQLPFTDEELKLCQGFEESLNHGMKAIPFPEELYRPAMSMIQSGSTGPTNMAAVTFGAGCQIHAKKMEHFAKSLDFFKE